MSPIFSTKARIRTPHFLSTTTIRFAEGLCLLFIAADVALPVKASTINVNGDSLANGGVRTVAAPVATNDVYNIDQDTPLNPSAPGVLGNDTDADGNALTAIIVS